MYKNNPNNLKSSSPNSLRRKVGMAAIGLTLAGIATFIGHEIEKPAPPATTEISTSQQAALDKTAANTTMRLLNDKFALDKQVVVSADMTTVTVQQDKPDTAITHDYYSTLKFAFEGASQGTSSADVERFLQGRPHIESISVSKNGTFTLGVGNFDSDQPSTTVQIPTIALNPHNDAVPLSQYTTYQQALIIANGVNGGDSPGGIPSYDQGELLPSDVPSSLYS